MDTGLSEIQIENIKSVFAKYSELEDVILFGSRAKGNYKNNSDIDIALKGDIWFTIKNKIFNDIEELFLPFYVDIIIYSQINNQDLKAHIERVGISIYNKKNELENKFFSQN